MTEAQRRKKKSLYARLSILVDVKCHLFLGPGFIWVHPRTGEAAFEPIVLLQGEFGPRRG